MRAMGAASTPDLHCGQLLDAANRNGTAVFVSYLAAREAYSDYTQVTAIFEEFGLESWRVHVGLV